MITSLPDGTLAGPGRRDRAADGRAARPSSAGQFAAVTLGEPLVGVLSLYGVRRALSAENRNRIRFEMRREVKRLAQAAARASSREATRHLRDRQRAARSRASAA